MPGDERGEGREHPLLAEQDVELIEHQRSAEGKARVEPGGLIAPKRQESVCEDGDRYGVGDHRIAGPLGDREGHDSHDHHPRRREAEAANGVRRWPEWSGRGRDSEESRQLADRGDRSHLNQQRDAQRAAWKRGLLRRKSSTVAAGLATFRQV